MKPSILTGKLLHFVAHTTLCFILFSLVLAFRHGLAGGASDLWSIHTGLLQDLTAELPIGRQALVSSLAVMPLGSLAALPFLPFLKPAAYGFAYLYGLAALLALSALPLRGVLRHFGLARVSAAAPALLALAAFLLGSTGWTDLLPCLAMLIVAVYFETRDLAELRALAGVFWALALFAHLAGLCLVAGLWAWRLVGRFKVSLKPETRAVRWIQGASILYGFGVYLFLNWMIMGSPVYPFASAPWWRLPAGKTAPYREQLTRILAREYSDCRPVVSGLWGYTVQPLLEATEGYHVADFHPGKLPSDEPAGLVLVMPVGRNPLAPLSDMTPDRIRPDDAYASPPVIVTTPDWVFARIVLKKEAEPAGGG